MWPQCAETHVLTGFRYENGLFVGYFSSLIVIASSQLSLSVVI
jgi:hypothetical protein